MKKIFLLIFILFIIIVLIFCGMYYKSSKIVNNINNNNVLEYILNIESYNSEIELKVISNKNENEYKMLQTAVKNEKYTQKIIEPLNIQGLEVICNKEKIEINNAKINISKILKQHDYISKNMLDLFTFIQQCCEENIINVIENEQKIIIELEVKNEGNKYSKFKNLCIDKNTQKPTYMEIKDEEQNTLVYIQYKEITIKSSQEKV